MNKYAHRTNFSIYNTNPAKKNRNSYHATSKLLYENHETEQQDNKTTHEWYKSPTDNAVHIIIKNFQGTLVADEIKTEFKAIELYPVASTIL
jgi:hypothetical protein